VVCSVSASILYPSMVFLTYPDFYKGGPRNILPGTVVFALLGAGGQAVANIRTKAAEEDRDAPKKGFLHSKWSPVTPLTDKDYEHYLEEKLLRVEAEIAIVDDSIRELRATEQSAKDSTTKVES